MRVERRFERPVLLTGATGFLGRSVLVELLVTNEAPIVCPVRARSHDEAMQRGRSTLRVALGREPSRDELARVQWLRGDIEEHRLGVADEVWQALVHQIGDIIHCAASVRFDLDLEDAHRINVTGTANVFELAQQSAVAGEFGCFHHVSTAYASGVASGLVDADHVPPDSAGNFRNTYERTKARAEQLLREQSDVEVAIYRPSIVGGNTFSGHTDNWNVLYMPMRMIANGQLPMLPHAGLGLVDSVGVDYVARGIVHLAQSERGDYVGHHLTAGPDAFTVSQFVDITCRMSRLLGKTPSDVQLVGPARWSALTASLSMAARAPKSAPKLRRWGRIGERALRGFVPYAPYTGVSSRFDNRRERLVLEAAGIAMPPALTYLETIATFAIGTDFGRQPIVADGVPAAEGSTETVNDIEAVGS